MCLAIEIKFWDFRCWLKTTEMWQWKAQVTQPFLWRLHKHRRWPCSRCHFTASNEENDWMHSSDCLSRQTTNNRRYCISSLLITWHSSCHYSLCFKHVSCLSGHSFKNAVPLYRKKCCQWLAISLKWLMQTSSTWENIVIGNETLRYLYDLQTKLSIIWVRDDNVSKEENILLRNKQRKGYVGGGVFWFQKCRSLQIHLKGSDC